MTFLAMKFQNPDWRFQSPGPLTSSAVSALRSMAMTVANQAKRVQDVIEDFKWRFSSGTAPRSSTQSWAESDLYTLMDEAGENAPLFIEMFVNACSDLAEQGFDVPSIATINNVLFHHKTGYSIEGDTIVAGMKYTVPVDASGPVADDDGVEDAADDEGAATQPSPSRPILHKPEFYGGGPMPGTAKLKAFLCHSSGDKGAVKLLHGKLRADGYAPWLDEVDLLPGQDWEAEIKKAVKASHVVIVFLSESSITKTGFVQKEIKFALDVADEQPEGTIYIIPARLEACKVPDRLSKWHWVDLFKDSGYSKLLSSLAQRTATL